jgi:hypothetical protein
VCPQRHPCPRRRVCLGYEREQNTTPRAGSAVRSSGDTGSQRTGSKRWQSGSPAHRDRSAARSAFPTRSLCGCSYGPRLPRCPSSNSPSSRRRRPKKHESCSHPGGVCALWGNTPACCTARSGGRSSAIVPQNAVSKQLSRSEKWETPRARHDESARRLGVTPLRFPPEADPTSVGLSANIPA